MVSFHQDGTVSYEGEKRGHWYRPGDHDFNQWVYESDGGEVIKAKTRGGLIGQITVIEALITILRP